MLYIPAEYRTDEQHSKYSEYWVITDDCFVSVTVSRSAVTVTVTVGSSVILSLGVDLQGPLQLQFLSWCKQVVQLLFKGAVFVCLTDRMAYWFPG